MITGADQIILPLPGLPRATRHPARYTPRLLPVFADLLAGCRRVLDPFGGTGRVFELERLLPGCTVDAVEIEPEWCAWHPRTTLGNALALPWPAATFDGICTSPCYGNRMADHHEARDASRRNTYTHALGRPLHPDNAGALQWGDAYRDFHQRAWREAVRVLEPNGRFALNVKDHIRAGARQQVTAWHVDVLAGLGLALTDRREIACPGQRCGANGDLRIEHESVLLFVLGGR